MSDKFDVKAFDAQFNERIKTLANSERITKESLKTLSRDVLEVLHITEDIGYVNRLLDALTPVNRKACVEFYQAFGGFNYNKDTKLFTKKNKKVYEIKSAEAKKFLADPLNNLWTWADRHIQVTRKDFSLDVVKDGIARWKDAAKKANIPTKDLLAAILNSDFTDEEISEVLESLFNIELE